MQILCFPVENQKILDQCFEIRRHAFSEEQNVPKDIERDSFDNAARHFAVSADKEIIATCRVRLMGSAAKIERVAVEKKCRNLGIGQTLMKYILHELSKMPAVRLYKLSAQAQAVPFYEKLGFTTRGGEYMEAGMPHYDMVLEK